MEVLAGGRVEVERFFVGRRELDPQATQRESDVRSRLADVAERRQVIEHEADVEVGDVLRGAQRGDGQAVTVRVVGRAEVVGQVQHGHLAQHVVAGVPPTHLLQSTHARDALHSSASPRFLCLSDCTSSSAIAE